MAFFAKRGAGAEIRPIRFGARNRMPGNELPL